MEEKIGIVSGGIIGHSEQVAILIVEELKRHGVVEIQRYKLLNHSNSSLSYSITPVFELAGYKLHFSNIIHRERHTRKAKYPSVGIKTPLEIV